MPEFLGNRAPFPDPHARAILSGLGLDDDLDSLIALYVAGLCGIGYGLKQIIETQRTYGAFVRRIIISGGAGQSDFVRRVLADATGAPVVAVRSEEPVTLGSAILGAVAGSGYPTLAGAMAAMSSAKSEFRPSSEDVSRRLHDAQFEAFVLLQECQRKVRRLLNGSCTR